MINYVLLAKRFGTPLYVYDRAMIRSKCQMLKRALPGISIHYAMKANSNPEILKVIRAAGVGVEAVSIGELRMARRVGFPSARISFTCSNIGTRELALASKMADRVHLDSLYQLELWGRAGLPHSVSLRLNQGIGAGHHAHVITGGPDSKFGILLADVPQALRLAQQYGLRITGIQQHIGSNVLDHRVLLRAAETLLKTAKRFPDLEEVDFGGGFGIPYAPEEVPLDLKALGTGFSDLLSRQGKGLRFSIEPGRYLVAEAGTLLVEVMDLKRTAKHLFVGINSGFNHLIRPAMYGSYHPIRNVSRMNGPKVNATVVGNVCESGDILARRRELVEPRIGDLLAIGNAGAYGFSMASFYNLRTLPKEVLVESRGAVDISFVPSAAAR